MRLPFSGASRTESALSVLMMSLLVVLAGLQYRWTGQLGTAEREQMRVNVQSAVARYAADFDRELTRTWVYFLPSGSADAAYDAALVERHDYWASHAPHPELVRAVYLARRVEGEVSLRRLDSATRQFEVVEWDPALEPIRRNLLEPESRRHDHGRSWETPPVIAEVPALVVPLSERSRAGFGRRSPAPRGQPSAPNEFAILELDHDYIVDELLPLLTERYFGDDDYHLRVSRVDDTGEPAGSAPPAAVIYRTGDLSDADPGGSADAMTPLFGLLPWREFPALLLEAGHSAQEFEALGRRGAGGRRARTPAQGAPRGGGEGTWVLTATHRSGSLAAAIATVRLRNLSISFGILVLLAGSVLLILVSSRRAQDLARQKMEFVAGVSHELRTPLAVICSASQNLADGVTTDPQRVRDYGKLIRDEGRRLSEMVGQVLEHASVQSGRTSYAPTRVRVSDVVEAALEACKPALDEGGFTVEATYAEGPAEVQGDAQALGRAVQNLIVNAVKYAGDEAWIGIRVASTGGSSGDQVSITVADRGRGIAETEREQIFEPFFRGAAAIADQIHGNGLGLSLVKQIVEAHGGRVSVVSETAGDRHGSAFTLRLPAALAERRTAAGDLEGGGIDDEVGQPARG